MASTTGKRSNAVKRGSTAVINRTPPMALVDAVELPIAGGVAATNEGSNLTFTAVVAEDVDSSSVLPLEIVAAPRRCRLRFLVDPSLRAGRIITLIAAAMYGTNFATVKLLDESMPLSISAINLKKKLGYYFVTIIHKASLRFGVASTALSVLVVGGEKGNVDPMVKRERCLAYWSGVEVGFWYSVGYLAQAEALQTVAAGKSAFFSSLAVMVVPILDVVMTGRILHRSEIISVILACIGTGLLEIGSTGFQISSGDVLAFMQTIFFGIGYWRLESASHAHPNVSARVTVGQLNAITGVSWIYAATGYGLGNLDISWSLFRKWLGDPFVIGAILWTGLISTALALYLETVSLKVVSAAELTLLMTTTSLWGASFAYVTIGEVLSPTGLFGGLLILGGCVLGNHTSYRTNKYKLETPNELTSYNDLEEQKI